jgi:hypothetical protein
VADDLRSSEDDLPTLAESLARAEAQLKLYEAAGLDESILESFRRNVEFLRRAQAEGKVFLRGKGDDGDTIMGFSMPSEPRSPDE